MSLEESALFIVKKLSESGYIAYYAGGWVRDHLRGVPADDIDIATDAAPEEIIALFEKTVPVGISFGVVLVVERGYTIEVATFRRDGAYIDGRHPTSIQRGSPIEDANRRDFTINGMFYDPVAGKVFDYVGGMDDLKRRCIRTIGQAESRFSEDRLRMLRAVRFAAMLDFDIEQETLQAIKRLANTLFPAVSIERVSQELSKLAGKSAAFERGLALMRQTGLLEVIMPQTLTLNDAQIAMIRQAYALYPDKAPAILYLLPLLGECSEQEAEALAKKFKMPTKQIQLAKEYVGWKKILSSNSLEPYLWALFFALDNAELLLQVIGATLGEKSEFLYRARRWRRQLGKHIERIRSHAYLVTAQMLQQEGIKPGPLMGRLLQEGQRIAVNQDLMRSEDVLRLLKSSPLWVNAPA